MLQNEHWAESGDSRRSRVLRTSVLERVLGHGGLSVREWAGQYLLTDGKGQAELAADLTEVWISAERLLGVRLDPLDKQLVDAL